MIHLMLNTNIVLNLLLDRKHDINMDLVNTFKKLLNYNEVKLIIPSIVVQETNRNIKQVFLEHELKSKMLIKELCTFML